MKYYKYLDLDYLDVQKKLIKYLEGHPFFLVNNWNTGDVHDILSKIPELQEIFKPFKITISRIWFHTLRNNEGNIHRDRTLINSRINIPVLNCIDTETKFYKISENINLSHPEYKERYEFFPNECSYVDSCYLTQPALLRVTELHQVVSYNKNKPRVSATILFKENLDNLWFS